VGTGDIVVWSFQAVKSLPTGDGGMITTNDEAIAKKLKNLIWLGVEKSTFDRVGQRYTWDYDIKHGGIKAYMTDLTAVIGIGQLRRLEQTNARRREIQKRYNEAFKHMRQITLPNIPTLCSTTPRSLKTGTALVTFWAMPELPPLCILNRLAK